jgi:hypothetical protein
MKSVMLAAIVVIVLTACGAPQETPATETPTTGAPVVDSTSGDTTIVVGAPVVTVT